MTSTAASARDNTTNSLIADLQGKRIILHGAGAAGTYALRYLTDHGLDYLVVCFVDNDLRKHDTVVAGVPVMSVEAAREVCDDAIWVACALSRPAAPEIRAEHLRMNVQTLPLWKVIPVFHGLPPDTIYNVIYDLLEHDPASTEEFQDQIAFRKIPDYDQQQPPTPASETYFPDFIKKLDRETFVDCGAAYGDTIQQFLAHWPKPNSGSIVAIEPDRQNFDALLTSTNAISLDEFSGQFIALNIAASDRDGVLTFQANGDYSSRVTSGGADPGNQTVRAMRLDDCVTAPTYIKADVESAELTLLWGARKLLAEHMPVLAICAYHTSEHLWQVPLLAMSINSDYVCYLRRYGEGATELVWYFVPPDRVIRAGTLEPPPATESEPFPAQHETYSDLHEG